jgi:hypothetical protein
MSKWEVSMGTNYFNRQGGRMLACIWLRIAPIGGLYGARCKTSGLQSKRRLLD